MAMPILQDACYHEGRGPELQSVSYTSNGTKIATVDYFNPDDVYIPASVKRLHFVRPQVHMWTPEEIYANRHEDYWAKFRPAAVISLGKSPWLRSFSQQHLTKCSHFQIMFYNEYLDIICEEIVFEQESYVRKC